MLAQLVLSGKILVLYERPDVKVTHSKLFADLTAATSDDLVFKVIFSIYTETYEYFSRLMTSPLKLQSMASTFTAQF